VRRVNGESVRSMARIVAELNRETDRLEAELRERLTEHPHTEILRSLPGLGTVLAGRVLGDGHELQQRRHQLPGGDRGRARRGAVVHQRWQQLDRTDHHHRYPWDRQVHASVTATNVGPSAY
jgi:transposase